MFRPTTVLTGAKPNILMDAASNPRITDFGLAAVARNLDSVRNTSGDRGHTPRWTAPEVLEGKVAYSKEADVFSFAMIMIEVRYEWVTFIDP